MQTHNDDGDFLVLINDEEQYSLWSAHHPIPAGWRQVGPCGGHDQCIANIEAAWVDMRPRSLRDFLQQH